MSEQIDDTISRQAAIDALDKIASDLHARKRLDEEYIASWCAETIEQLPSVKPEIIRCKDCKHNPKDNWFGCPMSHLNERQRPEDAWCWRAERRTDATD